VRLDRLGAEFFTLLTRAKIEKAGRGSYAKSTVREIRLTDVLCYIFAAAYRFSLAFGPCFFVRFLAKIRSRF
jgi:hypothetical protein